MTRDQALALLGAQCASTIYPVLDATALGLLLDATARWTTWLPSHTYNHGDQVIPTVRNGHVYKAIVNQQYSASPAGVSDTTEPIWPLFSSPDSRTGITRPYWSGFDQMSGNYALSMVSDGTVVWQDAGPDSADPWDIRLAVYNAWLQKYATASADYDVTLPPGKKLSRSQVAAQCLVMATRYAPTGIA